MPLSLLTPSTSLTHAHHSQRFQQPKIELSGTEPVSGEPQWQSEINRSTTGTTGNGETSFVWRELLSMPPDERNRVMQNLVRFWPDRTQVFYVKASEWLPVAASAGTGYVLSNNILKKGFVFRPTKTVIKKTRFHASSVSALSAYVATQYFVTLNVYRSRDRRSDDALYTRQFAISAVCGLTLPVMIASFNPIRDIVDRIMGRQALIEPGCTRGVGLLAVYSMGFGHVLRTPLFWGLALLHAVASAQSVYAQLWGRDTIVSVLETDMNKFQKILSLAKQDWLYQMVTTGQRAVFRRQHPPAAVADHTTTTNTH